MDPATVEPIAPPLSKAASPLEFLAKLRQYEWIKKIETFALEQLHQLRAFCLKNPAVSMGYAIATTYIFTKYGFVASLLLGVSCYLQSHGPIRWDISD